MEVTNATEVGWSLQGVGQAELTFVPRLSTMRVFMPQRDIQLAIIRPAGPAPMMSTSTSESACIGAIFSQGGLVGDSVRG